MPTYTYNCAECGPKEINHSMDTVLNACPYCDSQNFNKIFTKVGVQFKGKGFYSTDSRSGDGK